MVDLKVVILLYACKLAFLASPTWVKIIEFPLKNEARKAYLHVHKRIIIMPTIYERVEKATVSADTFFSSYSGTDYVIYTLYFL